MDLKQLGMLAMQKHIKTRYIDQQVVVAFARYQADRSIAITLHDLAGDRVATATTCLQEYDLTPRKGNVFIKNYSENKDMVSGLVGANIIKPSGTLYQVGPHGAEVYECTLTDEAMVEMMRQMTERGESDG